MTISNLPQRPEENINCNTQLYQELMGQDAEISAQILSVENSQNFSQLAGELVKKHQSYDIATDESLEPLVTTVNEFEDCLWFAMTDESKWEDEEERSELAEIEEDRKFYTSQMCI